MISDYPYKCRCKDCGKSYLLVWHLADNTFLCEICKSDRVCSGETVELKEYTEYDQRILNCHIGGFKNV